MALSRPVKNKQRGTNGKVTKPKNFIGESTSGMATKSKPKNFIGGTGNSMSGSQGPDNFIGKTGGTLGK